MVCEETMVKYEITYRNRAVEVILEFPEQPDREAEKEAAGRLKELYLGRIVHG